MLKGVLNQVDDAECGTDPPSIQPSGGPSAFPSLADQLSDSPSGVPTSSERSPYHPSFTHNPT